LGGSPAEVAAGVVQAGSRVSVTHHTVAVLIGTERSQVARHGEAPAVCRGSTADVWLRLGYRAAARAAFTMPAPKKELRLALP